MNIFVDNKNEFEVKIVVGQLKSDTKSIVADISAVKLKETYGDQLDAGTIEEHSIWFRYPDFGDQPKITGNSLLSTNDGFQVNIFTMRLNLITTLIKKWTFKEKNAPVEPTVKAIKSLHPIIANLIGLEVELAIKGNGIVS